MKFFDYKKISKPEEAFGEFIARGKALKAEEVKFIAGGTTLIDLMKLEVETPAALIDLNNLPMNKIEKKSDGLSIGALVKNAELAQNEVVKKEFTVLSQALLSGASAQLRNKATTAGNLLQRTRCVYFRDNAKACNKRDPGSGCAAIEGHNRNLAIMGTTAKCIASNPSDMNVALTALEATIQMQTPKGTRQLPIGDFFVIPENPQKENELERSELITGVQIANLPAGTRSLYLKLRDRASYEFALASAAIVVTMKGSQIARIRIAMGGIGTKPWRSPAVEKMLEGKEATTANFQMAAEEFLKGAKPQTENGFKVELAKRCLVHALKQATQLAKA